MFMLSFKWSGFLLPQNNKKCIPKAPEPARTFARNAPENFPYPPQQGSPPGASIHIDIKICGDIIIAEEVPFWSFDAPATRS
jgi:hypothetical protein